MSSLEERRRKRNESQRRDYYKHYKARRALIERCRLRMKAEIFNKLGEKCVVCGTTEKLVAHHLDYKSGIGLSRKALKEGKLVLVCRHHHRAIHLINNLKRAGYLQKVLELLNTERQPKLI